MKRRQPKRLPKMLHPVSISMWYTKQLKAILLAWHAQITGQMEMSLPMIVSGWERHSPTWSDHIADVARVLAFTEHGKALALAVTERVDRWGDTQLGKVVEAATGKPMPMIARAPKEAEIRAFVNQNVALIKGLSEETSRAVSNAIYQGVKAGQTQEEIKSGVLLHSRLKKGIFGSAATRAELIAYDQIGKLNGQLNEIKQRSMGVKRYTWRTLLDNRVRDLHQKREGLTFLWDSPPVDGHPGFPIRCRCYAEPQFVEE